MDAFIFQKTKIMEMWMCHRFHPPEEDLIDVPTEKYLYSARALFIFKKKMQNKIIALSFVFDKYCSIID